MWAGLSCWTKEIEEGHRQLTWEIIQISKSKAIISESIEGFPNQL
jgi:hypothetical protein